MTSRDICDVPFENLAGTYSLKSEDTALKDLTKDLNINEDVVLGNKSDVKPSSAHEGITAGNVKPELDKKLGHRRVGLGGEVTYKKIQTPQIIGSIQLGIQNAVGGLASKPERDLLMQDFMTVEMTTFPSAGSSFAPAHYYSDFVFKTYAPIAFRYFRDLFGIQPENFLLSFCNSNLKELSNPGASGSIFYLTADDKFIIKTVQHKECEFLKKLLPGYYMNLNQNPRTLLPKFFGLFCYQCNSKNIRIVAMNNLLPSSVTMHQKYDLKGSTYNRKASKSEQQKKSPTYKDLDFMEHYPEGIFLEAETYVDLITTMERDCRVLESFGIMDYSLLVGVHNLDKSIKDKIEKSKETQKSSGDAGDVALDSKIQTETGLSSLKPTDQQLSAHHSEAIEKSQTVIEPVVEKNDVLSEGVPARNSQGERLILFVGIIDILQSYGLKKKLEHTWKSILHDKDSVSVHRPEFYAKRFLSFMSNTVFKKIPSNLKHCPSKRKSVPRTKYKNFLEAPMKAACYVADIRLESQSESKSCLSMESGSSTSGIGSMMTSGSRHVMWTPPVSVLGSTTWTEGTPSYTESSLSDESECPSVL